VYPYLIDSNTANFMRGDDFAVIVKNIEIAATVDSEVGFSQISVTVWQLSR